MLTRVSTYLYRRPKLILALLLGPPMLYMVVVYLGSLFTLLINSFFYLEEFTGLVVRQFTLRTYAQLFSETNLGIFSRTAGMALAAKIRGEDRIAITYFGEGALFQGVMHETFNMASKWKLPVIFYCENNRYAEMTPIYRASSVDEIYKWAAGYNMRTMQIDGNDVEVVCAAVSEAAERARAGEGPTFIEGVTYRLAGHMAGDLETYRTPEEIQAARAHEPLVVLREKLLSRGAAEETLEQIRSEVEKVVAEAVEAAQNSPWPDAAEAYTDVYAVK